MYKSTDLAQGGWPELKGSPVCSEIIQSVCVYGGGGGSNNAHDHFTLAA